MKLLAIDASGQVASVALAAEGEILAEYSLNYKKTHSQTLLPMIEEVLKMTDTARTELGCVVVSKGPGSFTGLRIGGATAKGLCAALNIPAVGVSTLEMLAANFLGSKETIVPIMDARRNQVYTAAYESREGRLTALLEDSAQGIDELAEKLNALNRPVIFLGDGVKVYRSFLEANLKCEFSFAAPHQVVQRAGSLAVLGMQAVAEGKTSSGAELELEYLRMSQAERERLERENSEAENA